MNTVDREFVLSNIRSIKKQLSEIEELIEADERENLANDTSYTIKTEKAAEILGIHRSSLNRVAQAGLIPYRRRPTRGGGRGGMYLFSGKDLAEAKPYIHELVTEAREILARRKQNEGEEEPHFISLAAAARRYNTTVSTIIRLIQQGRVEQQMKEEYGRKFIYVNKDSLEATMKEMQEEEEEEATLVH